MLDEKDASGPENITDRMLLMHNQSVKNSADKVSLVFALTWLGLMCYQLVRSMEIDAYELSQSHFDLLGFWVAFILSIILGLRLHKLGLMMVAPTLLVICLITYIAFIVFITAPSKSLIGLLFSRYGLFMWFVLGLGFASVLAILQKTNDEPRRWVRRAILTTIACFSLPALFFAQSIIFSPVITLSYQAVASSATIFMLIIAAVLIIVWGKNLSLTISFLFIGLATSLVAAVVLLQSTSIVAFWIGLLAIFFIMKTAGSNIIGKLVILIVLFLFFNSAIQSDIYEIITTTTRFSAFEMRGGDFTSATSRLAILDTFWNQFAISPIFGHFEAELISGAGDGFYVHSLPLSFLTHTGIIGSGIVIVILLMQLRSRKIKKNIMDPTEIYIKLLMLVVLVLGTVSVFMTWNVFWFMLGCMCRRPSIILKRI